MAKIGESEIGKLSLRYHPEVVDTPDRFRFVVRCLFREREIVSGWVKQELLEKLSDDGKQLFELTCVEVSGFGQPFEARVAKVVTDDPESVMGSSYDGNRLLSYAYTKFRDLSPDPEILSWEEVKDSYLIEWLVSNLDYQYPVKIMDMADRLTELYANVENGRIPDGGDAQWGINSGYFDVGNLSRGESFHGSTGIIPVLDEYYLSGDKYSIHNIDMCVDSFDGISIFVDGKYLIESKSPLWLEEQLKKAKLLDSFVESGIFKELMDARED